MYNTIILGAGQAGLAAAFYLKQVGVEFLILESNSRVGDTWRKRWSGLKLFTPRRYNQLPGLPPTGSDWELVDRLEVADYLERYVERFQLPVLLQSTCVSARKTDAWEIETDAAVYRSARLIVATGAYKDPFIPHDIAATFSDDIRQYHSSEVRKIEDIVGSNTSLLVVGAGASGQQLSRLGAAAGAEVVLTGPKVDNLPRNLLGKDIYWWLHKSGVMSVRTDRPPGTWIIKNGKGVVTVGETPQPDSVTRLPHYVCRYSGEKLQFSATIGKVDSQVWPQPGNFGVVIWCTGYQNKYPFLPDDLLTIDGSPKHVGGISLVDNSVAFLGLENLRRPQSSLLSGVGRDAKDIVDAPSG